MSGARPGKRRVNEASPDPSEFKGLHVVWPPSHNMDGDYGVARKVSEGQRRMNCSRTGN